MSKVMNHCHKCNTELPMEARFCNVCGTRQAAAEPQSEAPQPSSTKLLTPTRTIQPGAKRRGANNPIRPKTIARPVVYPSRPTNGGSKSSALPPLHDPSQSTSAPLPLAPAAPVNSSSPAIQPETSKPTEQPDRSMPADPQVAGASANAEINSHTLSQPQGEPSTPVRTPGIIRPVGSPSSARTIIPARPDPSRTITAAQQLEQAPAKASMPASTLPGVYGQSKQLAELPPQQGSSDIAQVSQQEQMAPSKQRSSLYDLDKVATSRLSTEYTNGQNSLADEETMHLLSPESFAATSKAGEHWRKSWSDRQYAEGGPAKDVSRGHASVASPLMAMQHSFARIGAIARTNKSQQNRRNSNLSFWITLFLMICLIGGLGAYITATYLPNSPLGATHVAPSAKAPQPSLTIQGTSTAAFERGQTIHLHGEYFGINDT